MKFIIDKASNWLGEDKPCENAKRETLARLDVCYCKSFEEYADRTNKSWLDKGYDHMELGDKITRKISEKCWTIEFNTIEELMEFVEQEDRIVVYGKYYDCEPNLNKILIYDDYIE